MSLFVIANLDTVYVVLEDFSRLGRAWVETDEKTADLKTILNNLGTGQYGAPVKVAACNLGRRMDQRRFEGRSEGA